MLIVPKTIKEGLIYAGNGKLFLDAVWDLNMNQPSIIASTKILTRPSLKKMTI